MSASQVQLFCFKNTAARWTSAFFPDQFASVQATDADETDIWFAENNFLLMGFSGSCAGTTGGGEQIIQVLDVAASVVIAQFNCFPDATVGFFFEHKFPDGYGYLSGAESVVLAVNLSAAMLTGHVMLNAWGTFNVTPDP
jgi:hypothetical protein